MIGSTRYPYFSCVQIKTFIIGLAFLIRGSLQTALNHKSTKRVKEEMQPM